MLDDQEYDDFIEAGRIAGKARDYGAGLIKVGKSLEEVSDKVEDLIRSKDAGIAFPAQISLNQIAAHYCARKADELVFKKGDLAKLDVGAEINGMVGDTATTINLGNHEKLVEASREALNNALKILKPNTTNSELGKEIEKTIKSKGFVPVNNLSGHGLGRYQIHTKPSIPNFDTGERYKLEPGMTFAIEPFASEGAGYVVESHDADIFGIQRLKPVRSPITRKVIDEIKTYKRLPFCSRWLSNKFGEARTNFALRELLNKDIIKMYPPLSDKNNGFISQAEHSVLMEEDKAIITTKI